MNTFKDKQHIAEKTKIKNIRGNKVFAHKNRGSSIMSVLFNKVRNWNAFEPLLIIE